MQLLIESTGQLTLINGDQCRVWQGKTEDGVRCLVFVRLLTVHDQAEGPAFDAALRAGLPPAELVPLARVLRGEG